MNEPSEQDYLDLCRTLLGTPDDFPVKPFGYQARGFVKVLDEFERGVRSTFVLMPTGTGKSILFLLLAKYFIEQNGGRVLIVADRTNLISQAKNEATALGLDAAIEMGGDHARPDFTLPTSSNPRLFACEPDDPSLVIASRQSLQGNRLKAWPRDHFEAVICDEADLSAAATYGNIFEHFDPPKLIGFSATWDRADKIPIIGPGCRYQSLAFEYPISEAIELGYLKRVTYELLPCSVDLSGLRVSGEDFNAEDLASAMAPCIEELVNAARPKLEGKRFIAFTPTIASAEAVASAFRSVGVSCQSVSGEDDDNDEVFAAFRAGQYQGLVNCALMTRGTNFPFVDTIVQMRPTKSRALFCQMVGRATRRFAGKPEALVLGYSWQTFGHKLVRPAELFAVSPHSQSSFRPEDFDNAGDDGDLLSSLKRAEAERRKKERIKLEVKARDVGGRSVRWDALGHDPEFRPSQQDSAPAKWEVKATDRQVEALVNAGFDRSDCSEWTKGRASATLGKLAERREKGLATPKQLKYLRRFGVPDAAAVTFAEAKVILDANFSRQKTG